MGAQFAQQQRAPEQCDQYQYAQKHQCHRVALQQLNDQRNAGERARQ